MIYYISGTLAEKNETYIVIEAGSIGYQVFVPTPVLQTLPEIKSHLKLFTFHYIREDQQVLYGFSSQSERELFIKLTSVSGIGPKVGIKVLSTFTLPQLINAIVTGKGAERLVIELKDKLPSIPHDTNEKINDQIKASNDYDNLTKDLTLALKSLGYHQDEIKRAFSKSKEKFSSNLSLEEGIKLLLKQL
jgi:holliday junction DNA helicase RuvA